MLCTKYIYYCMIDVWVPTVLMLFCTYSHGRMLTFIFYEVNLRRKINLIRSDTLLTMLQICELRIIWTFKKRSFRIRGLQIYQFSKLKVRKQCKSWPIDTRIQLGKGSLKPKILVAPLVLKLLQPAAVLQSLELQECVVQLWSLAYKRLLISPM